MKKILAPVLTAALALCLSTAAPAQTMETTTTTTTTVHVMDSDGFTVIRDDLALTADEDIRLRSTLDAELAAVGPIYDEAALAIRADLEPDQVIVFDQIFTDRARLALARMSPDEYALFRSELSSRLDLTPEQEIVVYNSLDRSVAEAAAIERATFAQQYCDILGMERHEMFTSEVASVELISEEVAEERTVEVEVREAEVEVEETFIRDLDMK